MTGTTLTGWLATGVLILTASYCLLRVGAARRLGDQAGARADLALAMMILVMAAMFCPLAASVPSDGWLLVSAALTVTLLVLASQGSRRDGRRHGGWRSAHRHCWHHVSASLAMFVLIAANGQAIGSGSGMAGMPDMNGTQGMTGMPGMPANSIPLVLTVPLLAYFWVFTMWSGIRLVAVAGEHGASGHSAREHSAREHSAHEHSAHEHSAGPSTVSPARWVLTAPELGFACETVMGIAMGYMVLAML